MNVWPVVAKSGCSALYVLPPLTHVLYCIGCLSVSPAYISRIFKSVLLSFCPLKMFDFYFNYDLEKNLLRFLNSGINFPNISNLSLDGFSVNNFLDFGGLQIWSSTSEFFVFLPVFLCTTSSCRPSCSTVFSACVQFTAFQELVRSKQRKFLECGNATWCRSLAP